jgi:hypothetical protein
MEKSDLEPIVGTDLVLLLMAAPTRVKSAQNRLQGITRLEKLLFLTDRETNVNAQVNEPLTFVAYNFGPYSKQVYEAVEILEEASLLVEERQIDGQDLDSMEEAERVDDATDYSERKFQLTSDGIALSEYLGKLYPEVIQSLTAIKDQYAGMSLRELIRYVYTKYPESAENSIIRDKVL